MENFKMLGVQVACKYQDSVHWFIALSCLVLSSLYLAAGLSVWAGLRWRPPLEGKSRLEWRTAER